MPGVSRAVVDVIYFYTHQEIPSPSSDYKIVDDY